MQEQVYLSKFGPILQNGILTVDESQTTKPSIYSASARISYPCVSLLDIGSLQNSILQSESNRIVSSGAADSQIEHKT